MDASNTQATAWTGFSRLRTVLHAIKRLAGTDAEIADLAELGADLALEFAGEAQSSGEEFDRLLKLEARHD
jgi:hypothetical protein